MNLQQIKTRINSIEETIKLTRALQFVATAKLHRLRREHVGIKQLAQTLDGAFKGLRKHRGGELNFNFLGKRAGKPRTLFVTIYSNFGLCSSYNNLVTNHLQKLLKDGDLIVAFGNRSRSQLANFKQQIIKSYFDTNDSFTKLAITEISSELIDLIKTDATITKLVFVSTYFVNALTFIPASFVFLEADIKHSDQFKRGYRSQNESLLRGADLVLEPNSTELFLKQNLQFYLETLLAYTYSEAKLSEMSARRNAMESASDNAETLKRELELNYNRIRQASITQEISEIVAASLGEN